MHALNGLDLQVPAGSIYGLVGGNGAGKTTVLTAVAGLMKVDTGSINILEEGPFNPDFHRGRIMLLPQDAQMPPHSRVSSLLAFYGRLQGIPCSEIGQVVEDILEQVNLTDRAQSKIRQLSHGMRRRVAIAQTFIGDPELILLDEPLNGLDPREVINIRNIIQQRKASQTIVISSHLLNEIEAVCDCVAFVEKGKLVRQDSLENITRRSQSVSYCVEAGDEVPVAAIGQALTDAEVNVSADKHIVTVASSAEGISAASINDVVIPLLMTAGFRIVEIKKGSDLEKEYLKIL